MTLYSCYENGENIADSLFGYIFWDCQVNEYENIFDKIKQSGYRIKISFEFISHTYLQKFNTPNCFIILNYRASRA